jgi:hypothetical protein
MSVRGGVSPVGTGTVAGIVGTAPSFGEMHPATRINPMRHPDTIIAPIHRMKGYSWSGSDIDTGDGWERVMKRNILRLTMQVIQLAGSHLAHPQDSHHDTWLRYPDTDLFMLPEET